MPIRAAVDTDAAALSALARRSYAAAFGDSFTAADLAALLEETRSEAAFQRALQRDMILVLEEDGALRGYVQLGAMEMPVEGAGTRDRELRGVYVDPGFQNRGFGRRLLAAALNHPDLCEAESIYLDVWIRNTGARRLYESLGFVAVGERKLELTSGAAADPDIVMVRRRGS